MPHVKRFVEVMLTDPALVKAVSAQYVRDMVAKGVLVPREHMLVAGMELVPRGVLTEVRAELDNWRAAVLEHLDNGGGEDVLRKLVESPTVLDRPADLPLPEIEPDPVDDPEPEASSPEIPAGPVRASPRPAKMPPAGTPCADCEGPVPAPGDIEDQLEVSYARWGIVLCGDCHRAKGKKG